MSTESQLESNNDSGTKIVESATDRDIEQMGYAQLDIGRLRRTGDPEVVYGPGKSAEEIIETLRVLHDRHPHRAVMATRLDAAVTKAVQLAIPNITVDVVARTVVLGPLPQPRGLVLILSAGTSDGAVAAEAAVTCRVHGSNVERINDVGVSGLHRLLKVAHRLNEADCLIVVAGMEGALPSVVAGLTGVPLVAVPTSIGYGTGIGGLAALMAMLNSCAAGVSVVNIDNGYGAGVHAARIARRADVVSPDIFDE